MVTRYLRPGISEETTGSPKFLGNLHCPFAHVLADAGRTAHTRPLRCSSAAPGPPGTKAPTLGLSTPNSMAFGLAVYASQGGLLRPHARLASGCWSGSAGWAFHPQDSNERFQDCFLTSLSSSPKLCFAQWGRPTHAADSRLKALDGVTARQVMTTVTPTNGRIPTRLRIRMRLRDNGDSNSLRLRTMDRAGTAHESEDYGVTQREKPARSARGFPGVRSERTSGLTRLPVLPRARTVEFLWSKH